MPKKRNSRTLSRNEYQRGMEREATTIQRLHRLGCKRQRTRRNKIESESESATGTERLSVLRKRSCVFDRICLLNFKVSNA